MATQLTAFGDPVEAPAAPATPPTTAFGDPVESAGPTKTMFGDAAEGQDPYQAKIASLAKDSSQDPAQLYASVDPTKLDVNPDHYGKEGIDNPAYQQQLDEYNKQRAVQQLAIDIVKQRNATQAAQAPTSTVGKIAAGAKAVGQTAYDFLLPHIDDQGNLKAGGLGQGIVNVAQMVAAPIVGVANKAVEAVAPADSDAYKNAVLRDNASAGGVEQGLYNPNTGVVAGNLQQQLLGGGEGLYDLINGKPATDDQIESRLRAQAGLIRSQQNASQTMQAVTADQLGASPDSQLTPQAQQVFNQTQATTAGVVDPQNIAFLGAGDVLGAAGSGIKAAADELGVSPLVGQAQQAAKIAASNVVQATGKTINTIGNITASPLGEAATSLAAGALTGHHAGLGSLSGAVGGLVADNLGGHPVGLIGKGIAGAGQALSDYGASMLEPAEEDAADSAPGLVGKTLSNPLVSNAFGGLIFSIPNVLASDNPSDAADQLGNGAAFGMLGSLASHNFNYGLRKMGMQAYADLAPKAYGSTVDVAGTPMDLDALHASAIQGLQPEQQLAIQSMRGFLPGAQIYALHPDDMAEVAKAAGLPDTAGIYDAPQITTQVQIAGKPQKVILLNSDLAALNHEAGHYIWDNLNPDKQQDILNQVAELPPETLQDATQKYVQQLGQAYNEGDRLPQDALTFQKNATGETVPVFNSGMTPEETEATQKAYDYFAQDPQALAKEYIAENFSDLANHKYAPVESLAGQTGPKSLAQSFMDGLSTVQQAFGGAGRETALGFQVSPKLQNTLRGALKDIAARRKAEGKINQPQPPPAPVAAPFPFHPTPPAPAPPIVPPAPVSDVSRAYEDAADAAKQLQLPDARIKAGLKSAKADGFENSEDIVKRILHPQYQRPEPTPKPAVTPAAPAPLANTPTPEPAAVRSEPLNNIRIQPDVGPKASFDPFARTGIPSTVKPLSASGGRPITGLQQLARRSVDKDGNVVSRPTNLLIGRMINPSIRSEMNILHDAAKASPNPDTYAAHLIQIRTAIANGDEVNFKYRSSRSEVEGSPTNQERGEAGQLSDLGIQSRETVQKTMTPSSIQVNQHSIEPIFNELSGVHAKNRALEAWSNPRKKVIKQEFKDLPEVHQAIDNVISSNEQGKQVAGLKPKQVEIIHDLLDSEKKTRILVNGYSQDKVIANAKNLSDALEDSHVLADPELKRAYTYIKSGDWVQDIKDRNENMARGYRGDGGIFLDRNGVDQAADRRASEEVPPPKPIDDWKVQVLNVLEGGPSRSFHEESLANALSANRTRIEKPAVIPANPLQAKLDSLGSQLKLSRGARSIEGTHNILSPASETLRVDRIESADEHAPVQLVPSEYAQRAAGFMPHASREDENNLSKQTKSRYSASNINSNEQQQSNPSNSPLGGASLESHLWPTGNLGNADGGSSGNGGRSKTPLGSATLGTSGERGIYSSGQKDPFTKSRPSAPEQWMESYHDHLHAEARDGKYKGDGTDLFTYAGKTEQFIAPKQLQSLKPNEIKGGEEHEAYLPEPVEGRPDQIYKVTRKNKYGIRGSDELEYIKYLQDLDAATGGQLDIQILGITPKGLWPSFVTRMKYIDGERPGDQGMDREQREQYLKNLLTSEYGFDEVPGTRFEYVHRDTGVTMWDAHSGNFIQRPVEPGEFNGKLVPIDVHFAGDMSKPMFMPKAEEKGLYSQLEKNAEEGPDKATVAQWRARLGPQNGIKSEEARWNKLDQLFANKAESDSLTKQEVLDHLKANQPPLTESLLKGPKNTKYEEYQIPGGKNYRELIIHAPEAGDYASSHFPAQPNYLAHARVNDRTLADGRKAMFIEELQSDRGQQLRKEESGASGSQTPPMPFQKSWHEYLLKRLLNQAASEGKKAVAWTTGSQQNDRYNLSKAIDSIDWYPSTEKNATPDHRWVAIHLKNSPHAFDLELEPSGQIASGTGYGKQFVGKNIHDMIGKNVSDKILSEESGNLEGKGLDLGGSGMKGFYDKMVVDAANKIGKKYGAQVEKGQIEVPKTSFAYHIVDPKTGTVIDSVRDLESAEEYVKDFAPGSEIHPATEKQDVHVLPISPQMRERLRTKGQPLFMPKTPEEGSPEEKLKNRLMRAYQAHSPVVSQIFDQALGAVDGVASPQLYESILNNLKDVSGPIRGKEAADLAKVPGGHIYAGVDQAQLQDMAQQKALYEHLLKLQFLSDEDTEKNPELGHVVDLTGELQGHYDFDDLEKRLSVQPAIGLLTKLDEANATNHIEETQNLHDLGIRHLDEAATAAFDAYFGHNKWLVKYDTQAGFGGSHIYFPEVLKAQLANKPIPVEEGYDDDYLQQGRDYVLKLNPKDFIVQRQIATREKPLPGWRESGVTVLNNERRVHIQTDPETGVHVIPYATWIKGEDHPNFFEDHETQLAQMAALKAIEAMDIKHKQGQFYGVDVIPADLSQKKYGFGIAELNPTMTAEHDPEGQGGLSGYMADHPMSIDAYVSALRGQLPFHARIARALLALKVREQQRENEMVAPEWPHVEEGALAGAQL